MGKQKRPKQSATNHEQIKRTQEGPTISDDAVGERTAVRRGARGADRILIRRDTNPLIVRRNKKYYRQTGKILNPNI